MTKLSKKTWKTDGGHHHALHFKSLVFSTGTRCFSKPLFWDIFAFLCHYFPCPQMFFFLSFSHTRKKKSFLVIFLRECTGTTQNWHCPNRNGKNHQDENPEQIIQSYLVSVTVSQAASWYHATFRVGVSKQLSFPLLQCMFS